MRMALLRPDLARLRKSLGKPLLVTQLLRRVSGGASLETVKAYIEKQRELPSQRQENHSNQKPVIRMERSTERSGLPTFNDKKRG
ncbi:MAG: hypothetical protein P8179_00025 [Candidatus Thiodiazotropha sp.]